MLALGYTQARPVRAARRAGRTLTHGSRLRSTAQEQSQLSNTIFQMEQQQMMLESASMQASTVQAMAEGSRAMKAQMAAVSLDVVEDTMDDIREQMDEMQEIGEVLGQDLSGGMYDDSELEAEFADLEEELLDEQLLDISVRVSLLPRVASASVTHTTKCMANHRECCARGAWRGRMCASSLRSPG